MASSVSHIAFLIQLIASLIYVAIAQETSSESLHAQLQALNTRINLTESKTSLIMTLFDQQILSEPEEVKEAISESELDRIAFSMVTGTTY